MIQSSSMRSSPVIYRANISGSSIVEMDVRLRHQGSAPQGKRNPSNEGAAGVEPRLNLLKNLDKKFTVFWVREHFGGFVAVNPARFWIVRVNGFKGFAVGFKEKKRQFFQFSAVFSPVFA